MAIKKTARKLLKALSFDGIEVEAARQLADLKAIDPMKIFYKTIDYKVFSGGHEVPIRLFFPHEKAMMEKTGKEVSVLLFIHGGGWVTEHIDNYMRVCARMADATARIVVAVEYRLAPEHPFPAGLEDCYAVAKALYEGKIIEGIPKEQICLIGDSAGGNLTAALSLMAKDKKEFMPKRQILLYPATYNDYSEQSPYESVRENGADYLLTAGKMRDYINLYANCEEDKKNPYFAPLLAEDLSGQPDTLILTAEFDPLRDEGEAYGKKLEKFGNHVETHRIKDALHGYFALGMKHYHVQESFEWINQFLMEGEK